jgi:hypothetical protein
MNLLPRFVITPVALWLYQSAELVLRGRTTRVAHYTEPRFAWS